MNKSKYIRSSPSLSETEKHVVTLLAKGFSNRRIARATDRSEATVKFHLKNVFLKLGATSRVQVALMTMADRERLHGGASWEGEMTLPVQEEQRDRKATGPPRKRPSQECTTDRQGEVRRISSRENVTPE